MKVPGGITIDTENIVRAVAEAAIEMKATELTIIDVRGRTSFTDWFVSVTGQPKATRGHR